MTPKELYSTSNKIIDMPKEVENLKIGLSRVPPDYCSTEFRKMRGNNTYAYTTEGSSVITFKYETMSNPNYILIFGLPANESLKQSIIDLRNLIKKYPTSKMSLNAYEIAILIKVFGSNCFELTYTDTEFYDCVKDKMELMESSKWKKGKRVNKINSMCEFKLIGPEHYNEAYELISKWNSKRIRYFKFYTNILDTLDNPNRLTYGMFYNGTLVYIESGVYYGNEKHLNIDMGIGIGGITEHLEYKESFPKVLVEYINLVCRYNMYKEYIQKGIEYVYVGGIGGTGTDGLYNHKLKSYTKNIKRYKVSIKEELK